MSAKLRLALWVTFMVLLVSVMVLVFVLVINRHSLPEDPAAYLVDVVIDNANDVEYDRGKFEWNEMSVYKRGVYCSFYNTNGDLLLSADKEDMDFSGEPFIANKIRTVRSGDKEFYLYDYYVDMEVSGLWIRGVVLTDSHQGISDIILRLTIIILPVILIVTFLGALWISSRTFKPIEKIVATANSLPQCQVKNSITDIEMFRLPKYSCHAITVDFTFSLLVQNKHSTRSGYEASEAMLIFVIMGGQWMDGLFDEPSARAVNSPPPSCYKDSIEQVAPAMPRARHEPN